MEVPAEVALPTRLQSPFTFSTTTPAVSITELTDASFSFDPELIEQFTGASRFPDFVVGNDGTRISITTTDAQALSYLKGMRVEDVEVGFKEAATAVESDGSVTQSATNHLFSISSAIVEEVVEVTGDGSGKNPTEFQITFRACRESDGSDPTITFNDSGGGGE